MACQPAVQWNNLVEYIWFFDLIWHLFGISSSKMSYYSFSIFVAECFVHPFFCFWVTFGNDAMKIRKYKVIFVYILQGKMGKTEKNGKKITQLKWPKYLQPKTKTIGWTKHKLISFSPTQNGEKFVEGIVEKYGEPILKKFDI